MKINSVILYSKQKKHLHRNPSVFNRSVYVTFLQIFEISMQTKYSHNTSLRFSLDD